MKNKAFTLIELMGILIVIGIICVIAIPTINDTIKKSKKDVYKEQIDYIAKHAERWAVSNTNLISEDTTYYLTIDQMLEEGIIEDNRIIDPRNDTTITGCVAISFNKKYSQYDFTYQKNGCLYSDKSGANEPVLGPNMVPVKYNGTNLVVADRESEWYNYDNGNWANMVLVKASGTKTRGYYLSRDAIGQTVNESDILGYFVWVPRFKYQIFNSKSTNASPQTINVKFEKGLGISGTGLADGTWLTHPAFCTGTTDVDHGKRNICTASEVTGIWVSKFELSETSSKPYIKPGLTALVNKNLSYFETLIKKLASDDMYGLTSKNDPHIMTNSEWGAISYLSHSIYGNYNKTTKTNPNVTTNASNYTGGGSNYTSLTSQSTTNTAYGIYDMNGGKKEYVIGSLNKNESTDHLVGYTTSLTSGFGGYIDNGSFTAGISYPAHFDTYTYGIDEKNHLRGHLGDATREIATEGAISGWYSNTTKMPINTAPWFIRSTLFGYENATGSANSNITTRAILY